MNYPCSKFGDCSFSRFGFIMRTNTEREKKEMQLNDLLPRLTWLVTAVWQRRTSVVHGYLLTLMTVKRSYASVCLCVSLNHASNLVQGMIMGYPITVVWFLGQKVKSQGHSVTKSIGWPTWQRSRVCVTTGAVDWRCYAYKRYFSRMSVCAINQRRILNHWSVGGDGRWEAGVDWNSRQQPSHLACLLV